MSEKKIIWEIDEEEEGDDYDFEDCIQEEYSIMEAEKTHMPYFTFGIMHKKEYDGGENFTDIVLIPNLPRGYPVRLGRNSVPFYIQNRIPSPGGFVNCVDLSKGIEFFLE